MTMADLIPTLHDADLASLQSNAQRLEVTGTDKQRRDAADLLPLITAEVTKREAAKPPRKTPVRKKVAAKVEIDENERALAE